MADKNENLDPGTIGTKQESASPDSAVKEDAVLESRRRVLRKIMLSGGAIAGAGFLPDRWMKPVVNSVVVPAHAQTSAPTTAAPTTLPVPSTQPI
jgi:hypothetical protein